VVHRPSPLRAGLSFPYIRGACPCLGGARERRRHVAPGATCEHVAPPSLIHRALASLVSGDRRPQEGPPTSDQIRAETRAHRRHTGPALGEEEGAARGVHQWGTRERGGTRGGVWTCFARRGSGRMRGATPPKCLGHPAGLFPSPLPSLPSSHFLLLSLLLTLSEHSPLSPIGAAPLGCSLARNRALLNSVLQENLAFFF